MKLGDSIRCECGEAMGEACQYELPLEGGVMVEWMPEEHRESHKAARNRGEWPHNGALRLRVERSCADRLLCRDAEWTREVRS